jgi:hypothetical protein
MYSFLYLYIITSSVRELSMRRGDSVTADDSVLEARVTTTHGDTVSWCVYEV